MTLSKKIRLLALAASLLVPASFVVAEDIDLYQGGSNITGNKPNVLIILDNSQSWQGNEQHWPGLKQGEFELETIKNILGTLKASGTDVRVGLMMFTEGVGSTKDGGYLRYAIRDMLDGETDATKNVTGLQSILDGIKAGFHNNQDTAGNAKTKYGNAMYEAYKYFGNSTNYAYLNPKRDYAGNGSYNTTPFTAGNLSGNAFASSVANQYVGPLSALAPCSKNFIIFIGNGFPSTADDDPTTLGDATLSNFNATQIYAANKVRFADEWARHLKNRGTPTVCTGSGATQICADSSITTFTIDVYKDQQSQEQTDLLKSMAKVGGGEYFAATSETAFATALQSVFNQIQAVNSVFSSSSLPVSVNTQGTYLNQIYMGVFRPDGKGTPRWLGNLKQYKFKITTDATGAETLVLADADNIPAISTTTGFIKSDARSYWTSTSTFWSNIYSSAAADASDRPDGALVEKGAAAQRLRSSVYNTTTPLDPSMAAARKMLTCIPNCTTGATPPLFHKSNASLLTAMNTVTAPVSLTRAGPTVTADTTADLGLTATAESITISDAAVAAYNGSWSATRVNANRFTFTIPETPVTPATGNMTVSAGTSVSQTVTADATSSNMTYSNGTVSVNLPSHGFVSGQMITIAGANVSAGMSSAAIKCSSWPALTSCEYNGTFSVSVADANNFSFTPPSSNFGYTPIITTSIDPPATITAGFTTLLCRTGSSTTTTKVANSTVVREAGGSAGASKKVTVTLGSVPATCANPLVTSGAGRITGLTLSDTNSSRLNTITETSGISYGAAACGSATSYCFYVNLTSNSVQTGTTPVVPASPATTGSTITATGLPTRKVTSITRTDGNASNIATVTLTTTGPHGFGSASSVLVSGADQTDYNGTKTTLGNALTLSFTDPISGAPITNKITYTLTTGPATPSPGTAAKGANVVSPTTLINWMRGLDNKDDENSNNATLGLGNFDVRASIHGDVLHSRPAIVNYGAQYGGSAANPTIVAFYGANDGTLRAVKGGQAETDGVEKWAFVAPDHKNKWNRLYANSPVIKFPNTSTALIPTPTKRDYFFDGNIGVHQSADLATTHIFAAMRRGGRAIYAFDVSNPDDPKFLWTRSNTSTTADASSPTLNGHASFAEMGQTWSTPKVIPIKKTAGVACSLANEATYTRALVFGAGYDETQEDKANQGTTGVVRTPITGRGVFVLNAETGELIKLLQPADAKKYSFPADVTLLDTDADGCVDRLYAVDTGANIFRFDIGATDPATWKTYKIAELGDVDNDGGSDDRKFLFAPDPIVYTSGTTQMTFLMVGSGNREEPRDTAVKDLFFMVKDPVPAAGTTTTVTPAKVDTTGLGTATNLLTKITSFNSAATTLDTATVTAAAFDGWYIEYETGEKTVNAPLTISGVTYFGTNLPKAPTALCTPNLGTARGYAVNFLNGTSAAGDRDADGVYEQSDLYSNLTGGGLPPSPVAGTVCIEGNCKRFCIGCDCSGPECSAIEAAKINATPDPRRKRVYWYYRKDQ